MSDKKLYSLPELPYAYNALEPFISEAQLKLHHDKHHAILAHRERRKIVVHEIRFTSLAFGITRCKDLTFRYVPL